MSYTCHNISSYVAITILIILCTGVTLQTFGPGVGPILLYNLRCTGSERRLVACPSSSNYYTSHGNDAGVRCQHNPSPGNPHPAD